MGDADTATLEWVFQQEPSLRPSISSGSQILQLAAIRGRFMELLAESLLGSQREYQDHAFMIGIMSLMPASLHIPIGRNPWFFPMSPDNADTCAALIVELPSLDAWSISTGARLGQ